MNKQSDRLGELIYDRHCNLCLATKKWIEKRDLNTQIGFISAQDPELLLKYPQVQGLDLLAEITWIDQSGRVSRGGEAIAVVLQHLPKWKFMGRLLVLPGTHALRNVAYRWIARHRYQWFGRNCDTGSCGINISAAENLPESSSRIWPALFSVAVLLLVISPIVQNLRPKSQVRDNFPLSYYPMFSIKRENLHRQAHMVALEESGESILIHYRMLGSGGLNQNRRQLGRLMKEGRQEELIRFLDAVAERIVSSDKEKFQGYTAVAAVKSTYDLNAHFTRQSQQPVFVEIIKQIPIAGDSSDTDSSNLSRR